MGSSPDRGTDVTNVAHRTIVVLAATAGGLGLNYIYGIFLARTLGAGPFGLYSLGITLFNVTVVLAVMGLDHATLRFIPAALAASGPGNARPVLKAVQGLGFLFSVVATALLLAGRGFLSRRVFGSAELSPVLTVFALALPATVCSTVSLSALQAFHDVRRRMFVRYLLEPVARFLLALILLSAGWKLGGATTGFAVAAWLGVGVALTALFRMPGARAKIGVDPSIPWGQVASYCFPLLLGILVNVVATRSDILMMGRWKGPAMAGLYVASLQTASIILLTLASIESIVTPNLSDAIAGGNRETFGNLYAMALRWSVLAGLPLLIVFLLFPREILLLFGREFALASTCFSILAFARFLDVATGSANYVLLLSGKTGDVMGIDIGCGLLQLLLNGMLIPRFGIEGAAFALLLTTLAVNGIRLGRVYLHYRVVPFRRDLLKPVAAASLVFALIAWTKGWPSSPGPLLLAPSAIVLYMLLVMAMGLHVEDRAVLTGLLRRFSLGAGAPRS